MKLFVAFAALAFSSSLLRAEVRPYLLVADFEGADYGEWKTTGDAFGSGPAHGALPGQMAVDGFEGKGFANSFHGGDRTTGVLTSPKLKLERRYLRFLIGGGGYSGETCMNLIIDDKIVRTATGPNTAPGGSERLEEQSWDVQEFAGRDAVIAIVDRRAGGGGHINVDQIVQTDKKVPAVIAKATRELVVEKKLLLFPVKHGAPKRMVNVLLDGKPERFFEIELAPGEPDWWAPLDISGWKGRGLAVVADKLPDDSHALERIEQSDVLKGGETLYQEPQRAQLHFSAQRGWNNDPNGMVFAQGEYHLYFQHNPYGWAWGNMHWGHAVSRDLVHWEQEPEALYPSAPNDAVFSGSAVVDKGNTSGWKTGENDLLVAAFTSTGRGECMVYSNDRGRTWAEYEGNPVIKHSGRDSRLFWYEPDQDWVMAVYDEDKTQTDKEKERGIAFYTSPDLKTWTPRSRIDGFYECPDIFELPVDGDAGVAKWILTAASSDYMVGQFDGKTFTPETPKLKGQAGRGFYAAQTFSDEPKGRRVQMGWFQVATPGEPFNQAMSLPLELKLVSAGPGFRLTWQPVEEIKSLRTATKQFGPQMLKPGDAAVTMETVGELLEVRADFTPDAGNALNLNVRGVPIAYDGRTQEIIVGEQRAPAPVSGDGHQRLAIYVDRAGVEVFASDGMTYVPMPLIPKPEAKGVEVSAAGSPLKVWSLDVYELKSIWGK